MTRQQPISTLRTHSSPTRRSSDLPDIDHQRSSPGTAARTVSSLNGVRDDRLKPSVRSSFSSLPMRFLMISVKGRPRSEEHTSELPSIIRLSYSAFSLDKQNTHIHIFSPYCSSTYITLRSTR